MAKTIFQNLFAANITFAVCVSVKTCKVKSVDGISKDYFIILTKEDYEKIKGKGFRESDNYLNLVERDLTESEIEEFKSLNNKFIKVMHNANGRIYELKGKPFKSFYKPVKQTFSHIF